MARVRARIAKLNVRAVQTVEYAEHAEALVEPEKWRTLNFAEIFKQKNSLLNFFLYNLNTCVHILKIDYSEIF